ncbi:hypothetical protein D030_4478B, partial [Vibrio parahaemolyticus AQ3810]
ELESSRMKNQYPWLPIDQQPA